MRYPFKQVAENDPSKIGKPAGPLRIFGERSRYSVAPRHGTFRIRWEVRDAESVSDADVMRGIRPPVIRTANTLGEAIADLEGKS